MSRSNGRVYPIWASHILLSTRELAVSSVESHLIPVRRTATIDVAAGDGDDRNNIHIINAGGVVINLVAEAGAIRLRDRSSA